MKIYPIIFAVLVALSSGGAGCGSNNPVVTANTATAENKPETLAFALFASYVVVSERAVTLAEEPSTPVAVKRSLVVAYESARPVALRLREAAAEYNRVRAALSQGEGTAETVAIALEELQRVLNDAAPKIGTLAEVTSGAPAPPPPNEQPEDKP